MSGFARDFRAIDPLLPLPARGFDTLPSDERTIHDIAFARWFAGSQVVDADGRPLLLYHGTTAAIAAFDPARTRDGGLHFGTAAQARMRAGGAGSTLIPVYLHITAPRRARDTGGRWRAKIRAAKAAGCDGIVYLNRYEGISIESILRAQEAGIDPDRLSDREFRKWFPEACDSWIAFRSDQVCSVTHDVAPTPRQSWA